MDAIKAANQQKSVNKGDTDFLTWVKNYSGYNNKTKNTIINGLNTVSKLNTNTLVGRMMKNVANTKLQNSAYYKQYLKWRNS